MANIDQQVHAKFKMFSGKLEAGSSIAALTKQVEEFVRTSKAAPKSIGVEYLEGAKLVVLTLGYRDDEAGYPVKLVTSSLGNADKLDAADLARLEKRMGEEAAKEKNVICHELFITESHEFLMVLMVHGAA